MRLYLRCNETLLPSQSVKVPSRLHTIEKCWLQVVYVWRCLHTPSHRYVIQKCEGTWRHLHTKQAH